jgi:hypothetical protein
MTSKKALVRGAGDFIGSHMLMRLRCRNPFRARMRMPKAKPSCLFHLLQISAIAKPIAATQQSP